ncbi:GlxA family transcriptional regulator [Xinfangfangia sp. D13-10-4-6]|uniref:GlxA family transcriptional regulator n=1 Tax=Pseudogemmobacter hezensis TaxID=2737662 RepID=UPI001552EB15|nr:GlxA family transcriptional regulator [Pseudogemmobacter hezensis]NPD14617.1 GlxA family transcriptional regulator [Pseudogemmobacter hezensis]
MNQDENCLHLGFLIFPGFPMACLTSAIEPLRAANEITGKRAFRWSVVGESGQRVVSSAEVGFDPDLALADCEGFDQLYILSGPSGRFVNARGSNAALRRLARHGTEIGAFSGGIFPLARSGLLEGHKASVHWCYEAAFRAEFADVIASEKVITIDRGRLTAAGATAVFDLMLRLIDQQLGPEAMTEVACWFQHPFVRGEDVGQKTPALRSDRTEDMLPAPVARAIRLFAEHIEDPIQIAEVAEAVDLSSRQFDRSFKRSTGQSPLKYYRLLRLKKARQMALYSNDTITEIALAVGYTSTTPLVRHYQQAFGVTPQEDRKKANKFRVTENAPLPAI